jgi:translocation and assembly module TamB
MPQELTAAELSIRSESIEIDASLVARVAKPSAQTLWPLRVNGRGRLEILAQFLGPWMPQSLHSLAGGFVGNADLVVGLISGEVNGASLKVVQPRLGWDDRLLAQSEIAIDFDGQYAWPSAALRARSITVAGESISGAVKGLMTDDAVDLEVAFRADLGRLQGAFVPRLSHDQTKFGQTRFASSPVASTNTASHWVYQGTCEGNLRATRDTLNDGITIEARAKGRNLAIGQRVGTENTKGRSGDALTASELVWAEPNTQVDGLIVYQADDGAIDARRLAITTDWVSTNLAGRLVPGDNQTDVKLAGKATMRMEEVAKQLSTLAGIDIVLQGIHDTTIDIAASHRDDASVSLLVNTNLGWESGEVAGVVFGPSTIPIMMTETTVAIRQAVIPVDQGRITASADIHYLPGPMWMDVKPGVIARNLRMTPQLSDRWLQYLAPMVAQATRIDGTFGVELSQAEVNLVDPIQSRVRGQLQINQVNFDAGPVTTQLLSSIQQIQMIARGRTPDAAAPTDRGRNLALLPTQTVDFDFTNGLITHQRLFMTVDKARVITSGQVHVDGNLNLVTQVPLDAEWLGNDLKALAGTTVTLPITGTLSRPRLDPSAIRTLVGQIGTQAIQSQAENYLEKQLNRGLERLLGR